MRTSSIRMTGSPIAVASEGEVMLTGSALTYWWFDDVNVVVALLPSSVHRAVALDDKEIIVPAGTNLWIQSTEGNFVAVSPSAAAVLS